MKIAAKIPAFCLVILAALLSGCVATQTSNVPSSCAVSGEWGGVAGGPSVSWISLSFLAILVIMLFLSIAYMGGVVFRRIDWIIWAKDEFYQCIISAIMVLVVAWFAVTSCEIAFSLSGNDPFKVADIYLNDLIWEKTLRIATNIFLAGIYASITASFFLPLGTPPSGCRPFAGFDTFSSIMNFLFLITSTLFSSLLIQVILLKLIQSFMFKVVLPLGVFFRVFPFLRQAGATFIAVALGFYILFPMLYVMDKAIMESITGQRIVYENSPNVREGWGGETLRGTLSGLPLPTWESVMAVIAPMTLVQDVANLIPQAFFLPTINIVITYAFVKSMTRVFAQNFPSPFE